LRAALTNLRRHTGLSAQDLRASADLRWSVERGLHLCVQKVLEFASHLVAAHGLDAPDYATAIERLAEIRVVPVEFATRLRPLAGLRNVLVHGYVQVDLGIVEQVLNAKLNDLEQFAVQVAKFLAETAD
jgi:uncharacterized protein YutE (UPF0331/DUF86 family)